MQTLRTTKDIREFCRALPYTPVGLGVFAFDRFGLHDYFPSYEIIALRDSADLVPIRRLCPVRALEKEIGPLSADSVKKMNHLAIFASQSVMRHIDNIRRPVLLPPQSKPETEILARKHGWLYAAPPSELSIRFEDKKVFRLLAQSLNISAPKSIMASPADARFDAAAQELGLPFILQGATSRGGRGTFLIRTKKDFSGAMAEMRKQKQADLVMSRYIDALPVSTAAVATRWGIFSTNLQAQVVETEDQATFGDFLGHDWSFANTLPRSLHAKAIQATKKIGQALFKQGFRGFFGLDFLIDKTDGRLYVIECNPRFTGALPTLDLVQASLNRPPLCALHLLEFIADATQAFTLDYKRIQRGLEQRRYGSHLVVSSPHAKGMRMHAPFRPGTYDLTASGFRFRNANIELKNLTGSRQVILSNILLPNRYVQPHGIVCRILTKSRITDTSGALTKQIRALRNRIQSAVIYKPA